MIAIEGENDFHQFHEINPYRFSIENRTDVPLN